MEEWIGTPILLEVDWDTQFPPRRRMGRKEDGDTRPLPGGIPCAWGRNGTSINLCDSEKEWFIESEITETSRATDQDSTASAPGDARWWGIFVLPGWQA